MRNTNVIARHGKPPQYKGSAYVWHHCLIGNAVNEDSVLKPI